MIRITGIYLVCCGVIFLAVVNIMAQAIRSAEKSAVDGGIETRCVKGYEFVIDNNGNAHQIINQHGHAIACDPEMRDKR
jgi:hypothetical protein